MSTVMANLERNREIAPSGLAVQLARAEAEKGYSAAQFLNALRGVGTAEGSKRPEEAGGVHLKSYFKYKPVQFRDSVF